LEFLFCDLIDVNSRFASGHTDQNSIVVCEVFVERHEGESKDLAKSIGRWKGEKRISDVTNDFASLQEETSIGLMKDDRVKIGIFE
jgi:hypothetical protein